MFTTVALYNKASCIEQAKKNLALADYYKLRNVKFHHSGVRYPTQ